jgi:hypothetical protein
VTAAALANSRAAVAARRTARRSRV